MGAGVCYIMEYSIASRIDMMSNGVLSDWNIFYTTSGARGFAKIFWESGPEDVWFSIDYLVYILSQIFIIGDRYSIDKICIRFNVLEVMVFSKSGILCRQN